LDLFTKINSIAMQIFRIVQAVILMLIVALAASCAAGKEYTSKLFTPRNAIPKDSMLQAKAPLRFLNTDSAETDQQGWVTTDIIMGRDTSSSTASLDKLSETIPVSVVAKPATSDTSSIKKEVTKTTTPVVVAVPVESEPVAKTTTVNGVRNKRTRE
jgi:hypothetical protein